MKGDIYMNREQKVAWMTKYVERVIEDARLEKRMENGRLRVNIEVYDLLEESGLSKSDFFDILFKINSSIDEDLVLYLK